MVAGALLLAQVLAFLYTFALNRNYHEMDMS